MAVTSAGFKQQCPTCETMVLIKDMRQVGKKMECPKCKDRFVVEEPAEEAEEAEGKAKGNGKAAPAGKPKKRFREDDVDDDDDGAEGAPKGNGKYRDKEEDDGAPAKKKSAGGSKKTLPFILAGVGLVVLVVAAVLIIIMFRSPPTPPASVTPNPNAGNIKPDDKKDPPKVADQGNPGAKGLAMAGAELTNLLPNETEHVLYVNFKELLDGSNPYRDLIFGAGVFQDDDLRRKLGFALSALDTLIRADRYSVGGWTYSVLHFTESVDQKAVTAAFGLQPAAPINNQAYFKATKVNPWFEELSQLSLGVSSSQRALAPKKTRPLSVRFHNPQTLIVGDETPIVALLKANSQFKLLTDLSPPAANDPNPGMPTMPGGMQPGMMQPGGMQPGGMPPGGSPMEPPGKLPGRGASLGGPGEMNFGSQDDHGIFGEPQFAQVAPTIIAPPLNMQQPGGQGPMGPGGLGGPGPMGGMPGMPGMPGMNQPATPQNTLVRNEAWLTIDPALKAILDRLQYKIGDSKDRMMFASATDMAGARLDTSKMPEFKNRILWHPRQLWDITLLLEERKPRIKALGTGLVQREARVFQYRTEIICVQEADAKNLRKELVEKSAPQIARSLARLLDHALDIPKGETPPAETQPGDILGGFNPMGVPQGAAPLGGFPPGMKPMAGGGPPMGMNAFPMGVPLGQGGLPGGFPGGFNPDGAPEQKEEVAKSSKLTFNVRGASIDMKLDLVFDQQGYARFNNLLGLLAISLKSQVDLAGGAYSRHDLALALRILGEKGLTERRVLPGHYPPAALKRDGGTRLEQQPSQRMSWLTGLLPHLGHDALYQKLEFGASWQDPTNQLAAQTIVPQFLDPQYPDHARYATQSDIGVEMAATHVVGIAGVGLDAADYPLNDPAYSAKRGAFGYDGSAALADIAKGRGLSNTAVAIQIPHDGLTGVSPWIAGGGATVRGVPEKNSIAPFVLSTDRNGKPIQYKGKRGTEVIMADGSVRFVSANVSDAVFQAMCTVNGPTPPNFDLNKNPDTPLVPKQEVKIEDRTPVAVVPNPAKPAVSLKPSAITDPQAYHDAVTVLLADLQVISLKLLPTVMASQNGAQAETAYKQLVNAAQPKLQAARNLSAPTSKEGKAYHIAVMQVFDNLEQMIQSDLKQLVDLLRNPPADIQVRAAKILGEMQKREQANQNAIAAQLAYVQWLLSGAASQSGLTGEAKAFDDAANKARNEVTVLSLKLGKEMQSKDLAKLEAVYREIAPLALAILKAARQVKAPPGKEGQDYHTAFAQFLDQQERSIQEDLKKLIDGLKSPSPALLELALQAQLQELQAVSRLQAARQAFISTQTAAKN